MRVPTVRNRAANRVPPFCSPAPPSNTLPLIELADTHLTPFRFAFFIGLIGEFLEFFLKGFLEKLTS
ncbi:MAG: hypothetical protein LBI05_05000, partial [Planctomycetaceae bacterium]|nr:hypothetical protein [Planctomycetaceae bacterium]